MTQSSNWKLLSILAVVAVLAIVALAGIFSKNATGLLDFFHEERVQLKAKIDQEDVVSNHMQVLGNEVHNLLRDKKQGVIVPAGITQKDDQIVIRLVTPEDAGKVKARLEKLLQPIVSSIDSSNETEIFELNLTQPNDKSLVLKITQDGISERKFASLVDVVEVMKRRFDEYGFSNVSVQQNGAEEIKILFPAELEINEVKQLVGWPGKVGFHLVDISKRVEDVDPKKPPLGSKVISTWDPASGEAKILIKSRAVFTEKDLIDASASFDQRTNEPIVLFRFSKQATKRFCRFSGRYVGYRFAIVMDDVSITAPAIHGAICGGMGQIAGNFTAQQAENLAIWMRTGAMPAKVVFIDD